MASAAERWRELHRLHTRVETAVETILQTEHRLSANAYLILEVLAEHGHARMQPLAQAVELPQSTTSRLVAGMEATGLLTRYLCEADRRGVFTSITDAGRTAHQSARVTYESTLSAILSPNPGCANAAEATAGVRPEPDHPTS
jgi:DNA-binding MarR family transcriptional regulator